MSRAGDDRSQHLHDYRVNKTRGKEVRLIDRRCLHCGRDARPRYAYCSDECSTASRAEILAAYMKRRYGRV